MNIRYYQEHDTGDYLSVNHSTRDYYRQIGQPNIREGRATVAQGLLSGVCTTGIAMEYLRDQCNRVLKNQIPAEWIAQL
jgi:hypothetical protein